MYLHELIELCEKRRISETVLALEAKRLKTAPEAVLDAMGRRYQVMVASAAQGKTTAAASTSGLSGYNTHLLQADGRAPLLGPVGRNAMITAMAVSEQNARMGMIVAAPTAGSCGILPGVLLSVAEEYGISEQDQVMALLTAGKVGEIIATHASISGAEGGCQAECGSASAMAAAACVEMLGGTPAMCADAVALAIKFVMGLVCDPVAGLVEVPCVKRNASGAINALTAASMALAGVKSVIPADEVIGAMKEVGNKMCCSLKETSRGGLAQTETGKKIWQKG